MTWKPISGDGGSGGGGGGSRILIKRVKPEIGIRVVRTEQVACDVLALRIYGLTPFPESVEHFWQRVSAKNGLIALCMPLATVVLNGVLGDLAKARLVFWRWKNPLPGCRAFSELVNTDSRIDVAALKAKHGAFPRSPKDQNALWFQIYKKHAEALTVSEGHRAYLLTRDMASLSLIFALVFPLCALLSPIQRGVAFIYYAALLGQYLVVATSARNYGRRFVLNVLTEESHSK